MQKMTFQEYQDRTMQRLVMADIASEIAEQGACEHGHRIDPLEAVGNVLISHMAHNECWNLKVQERFNLTRKVIGHIRDCLSDLYAKHRQMSQVLSAIIKMIQGE